MKKILSVVGSSQFFAILIVIQFFAILWLYAELKKCFGIEIQITRP